MANNDRNTPHERLESDAGYDLRDRATARTATWFAWWWIWFIVLIALFAWFGGWGWWGYGGWWGWGGSRVVVVQPRNTQMVVSTTVPQLLNSPSSYTGKHVLVPDATVRQVVNPQSAWIGPDDQHKILVSVTPNSSTQNLSQGQKVEVSATAMQPPGDQAQRNLGLSASDYQRVKAGHIFLGAAVVVIPGQTPMNRPEGERQNQKQNQKALA